MVNAKYTFLCISLFIIFLSLSSFSEAHKKHQCPAHCVCSCPPPSGDAPPPILQNNTPPPTTGTTTPPPTSQNTVPPPTTGNAPPPTLLNTTPPPTTVDTPPPTSQSTAPPPNTVVTPPPTSQNTAPPPTTSNAPPPTLLNTTPPPTTIDTPPPTSQNTAPPPLTTGNAPPPASQNNVPPPTIGNTPPPTSQFNIPPPTTGDTPPPVSQNNVPPPTAGDTPPPVSQNNVPPPTAGDTPPPVSQNNVPPPTTGYTPPVSQNTAPPPTTGDTPPPTSQNTPPPPTTGDTPPPASQKNVPPPTIGDTPPPASQNTARPPTLGDTPPPASQNNAPPPTMSNTPPTPTTINAPPPTIGNTSPPTPTRTPSAPSPGSTQYDNQNSSDFTGCFSKVFAFGDSYTDTGNAALLGGFKSFIGSFMPHSPYGSTTSLPGQRLSNGRLVIDFLCDSLNLPPLPAYKHTNANFSSGCNFAIAGATSLSNDFFKNNRISHTLMWKTIPESIQTEIDWFNNFLSSVDCKGKSDADCKSEMEDTLFWIGELGGNDYARIFGTPIKVRWLTEMSVNHVYKIMKILLDRGAKYIVVQGLPPAGCCPIDLAMRPMMDRDELGCSKSANAMITLHNELLQKRLAELQQQYGDCHITYADTWNAYRTILANPMQFDFEEPFKACCGAGGGPFNFDLHSLCGAMGTSTCKNPEKYINWDGIHLTEAMHKHLANMFFHGGFCKPSFVEMMKAKKMMTAKKAHKFLKVVS